jgi:hypothetical protein
MFEQTAIKRRLAHRGFEEAVDAPSVVLGAIKRGVRVREQGVAIGCVVGTYRNPDASGDQRVGFRARVGSLKIVQNCSSLAPIMRSAVDPTRTAKLLLTVAMVSLWQTTRPSTAAFASPRMRSASSSPRRRSRTSSATPANVRRTMIKLARATTIVSMPDGKAIADSATVGSGSSEAAPIAVK